MLYVRRAVGGSASVQRRRSASTVAALAANGNSVVVVEHEVEVVRNSDWVIELGPGAGRLVGRSSRRGPGGRGRRSALDHRPVSVRRLAVPDHGRPAAVDGSSPSRSTSSTTSATCGPELPAQRDGGRRAVRRRQDRDRAGQPAAGGPGAAVRAATAPAGPVARPGNGISRSSRSTRRRSG